MPGPIENPAADLAILDAVVEGGTVDIVVGLASSPSIGAFAGHWSVEGDVLANGHESSEFEDLAGILESRPSYAMANLQGQMLHIGAVTNFLAYDPWHAGGMRPVARFRLCLGSGVAAGTYSLKLVAAEVVDGETG